MIDECDFILKPRKTPGHFTKKFRGKCDKCGHDRGYIDKHRANRLCRSCVRTQVHKNMDLTKKKKISEAASKQFKGHTPWNKGKTGVYPNELKNQWSKKQIEKMSIKQNRIIAGSGRRNPWLKGKELPEEIKIKISCSHRDIPIEEFDEFKHIGRDQDRRKFDYLGLSKQTFERDNYTCKKCKTKGSHLHAHHLNGFDNFPDERFKLDNLITLCKPCHESFHSQFGKGNNTKEQFNLFLTLL